jgi:hypothetical protein
MKILNIDTIEPFKLQNTFEILHSIVENYGKQFIVRYQGKSTPFIIKRRLTPRPIYRISIAHTTTHLMRFPTLQIEISQRSNEAFASIDYINRNDEHNLSGTFIIELSIKFLKLVGVRDVELTDAASISDPKTQCKFNLTPYLLLKSSTTFYGKWGFKPTLYNGNTSYETTKEKTKRLCQLVSYLQKQKISSILNAMKKINGALSSLKDPTKLQTYSILEDYETGVKAHEYFNDDWNASQIKRIQEHLTDIQNALVKYKKSTVHEMMQLCSCEEFKYLQQVFVNVPGVFEIGKNKYINKYVPIYNELLTIYVRSEYVLDLTKPSSKSTCL